MEFETVGVVASLGGLEAMTAVLSALPADFPAGLVVAQHGRLTPDPDRLSRLLQRRCALPVRTVGSGDPVRGPGVAVVPTGCTATVADDRFVVAPTAVHRPGSPVPPGAGDDLLRGIADTVGPSALAVVLTGMLHDGAHGVRAVKRVGGRVLVQDPSTARAGGMPSSAIATGCVDFVLPLHRLGPALVTLVMAPGGSDLLAVPTPSWAQIHP